MNTSEQLLTLFDINESDRENWRCKQLPPAIESSIVMNIASCTTGKMIDRRSTFVAMLSEYQIFSGTEKVHICPKAFLEVFNRECEEKGKSRNYEQLAMTE